MGIREALINKGYEISRTPGATAGFVEYIKKIGRVPRRQIGEYERIPLTDIYQFVGEKLVRHSVYCVCGRGWSLSAVRRVVFKGFDADDLYSGRV